MARMNHTVAVRRGAMLVEAALVLPIILLLTFGVIEYGWMFLKANQISMAAREGARAGSLAGGTAADVTAAVANRMAAAGINAGQYTLGTNAAPQTLSRGQAFTVTVSATYAGGLSVLDVPLIPVPASLSSSFTMAKEGP